MWDAAKEKSESTPRFDRELYLQLKKKGILLHDFLERQLKALGETHREAADSGFALDLLEYHTTSMGTAEVRSREDLKNRYPKRGSDIDPLVERLKDLRLLIEAPEASGSTKSQSTRLAHDTLANLVSKKFDKSLARAPRGRRILEKRAVEWQEQKTGPVLDSVDLAIVNEALDWMRTPTPDEQRLLDASRIEAQERKRQEDESTAETERVKKAAREADRKSRETTKQRLKDQEASNRKLKRVLYVLGVTALLAVAAWTNAYMEKLRRRDSDEHAKREKEYASKAGVDVIEQRRTLFTKTVEAQKLERLSDARRLALRSLIGRQGIITDFLLAVQAVKATLDHDEAVVPEAEQALHKSLAAVQGRFLVNHKTYIDAMAISPDGRYLVTTGFEGSVKIWNLSNPNANPVDLPGQKESVRAVAFSDDGRRLVTAGGDKKALVWDLDHRNAEPVSFSRPGQGEIRALVFVSKEKFVTAGDDGMALVWDINDPQAMPVVLDHSNRRINALAFASDGRLVTGGQDGVLVIWDINHPKAESHLRASSDSINALTFTPDGFLVSAGAHLTHIWNIKDPKNITAIAVPGMPQSEIHALLVTPDRRLITAGDDSKVTIRNLKNLSLEPVSLPTPHTSIHALALTPDGRLVTAGFPKEDGTARIWDLNAPKATPIALPGQEGTIRALTFASDGRIATGGEDGTARIWHPNDRRVKSISFKALNGRINALSFGPDGRLVTAGADFTKIWDLRDGKPTSDVLPGQTWSEIRALTFAPDGRLIIAGDDSTPLIWDLKEPKPKLVAPLNGHLPAGPQDEREAPPDAVWYRPNGGTYYYMTYASDGEERTGREGGVRALAFAPAPDGRLVSGGGDDYALAWNLKDTSPTHAELIRHNGAINAIAFEPRPDGRLVTAGGDGKLRIWNRGGANRKPVILSGHIGPIRAIAFAPAPDGRLVSVGKDGTARVWNLNAPTAVPLVLSGHRGGILTMAFAPAPDGRLVTVGDDGKALIWELDPKRLIELAAPVIGRNFTWDEWSQYMNTNVSDYQKTFKHLKDSVGVDEERVSEANSAVNGTNAK